MTTPVAPAPASAPWPAIGLALGLGLVCSAPLFVLGVPIAWMMGSMWANAFAAMAGLKVAIPGRLRNAMLAVMGVLLGSAFVPGSLAGAADWMLTVGGLAATMALMAGAGYAFVRFGLRRDAATAFFTALPGGLSEMVMAGAENGGDQRFIGLAHVIRLMLVVALVAVWLRLGDGGAAFGATLAGTPYETIPLDEIPLLVLCLLGWPLAVILRLPSAAFIGPLIVSALLHRFAGLVSAPPQELVVMGQVVIGASVGCRFIGVSPITMLRQIGECVVLAGIMLLVTALGAATVAHVSGRAASDLVLAFAPGGLAEMSLVALALGGDSALVSTHQLLRIFAVLAFARLLFALLKRWL